MKRTRCDVEFLESRVLLASGHAGGMEYLVPPTPAGMTVPQLAMSHATPQAATRIYWYTELPRSLPQDRTPGHLRVLFVGNSFTSAVGGQAALTTALAQAAKQKLTPAFGQVAHPAWTWSQLLADPLPRSRIAEKAPKSNAPTWDYVVIQPHCLEPLSDYAGMMRSGLAFDAAIRAAGARTVIEIPWGREDYPGDETAMVAACHDLARRLDADPTNMAMKRKASVVPVGAAWDMARHRRSDINLYSADRGHPSVAGAYLTACAFYSFFYGKSPEGLSPNLVSSEVGSTWHVHLPTDQAQFLQRIAYKVVKESGFAPTATILPIARPAIVRPATARLTWYTELPPSLPQQRTPGHLRVLFVGNSFTTSRGGQASLVSGLATQAKEKRTPAMGQIDHSDWTFSQLYADPKPRSRIAEKAPGSNAPTWDYVVIQPHCLEALSDYNGMMRAGLQFDAAIRAAGAKTVIFVPWGLEDLPASETAMVAACRDLAARMDADPANKALGRKALIVPVSAAWDMARQRRTDINLYSADRGHPSPAGSYLAACAFYSFFYGRSPEGLPPAITGTETGLTSHIALPKDQAQFLQRIAYKVVNSSGFAPTV